MNQPPVDLRTLPPVEKLISPDQERLPVRGNMIELDTNEVKIHPYPTSQDIGSNLGKIKLVVESVGPNRIFFKIPYTNIEYYMDRGAFLSANGSITRLDEKYLEPARSEESKNEDEVKLPDIGHKGTIEKTDEEILSFLSKAEFTRTELDRILIIAQRIETYSLHDQNKIKQLIVVCLRVIDPNDYTIRKFISLAGNLKIQESIDTLVTIALNQNINYEVVAISTIHCVRTALIQISNTGLIILRQAAIRRNNTFLLNVLEKVKFTENGNDSLKALLGRKVEFQAINCSILENGTMISEAERDIKDGEIISVNSVKICVRDKDGVLYGINFVDLPLGFIPNKSEKVVKEEKLDIIPEGAIIVTKLNKENVSLINGNTPNLEANDFREEHYKVLYSSATSLCIQNISGEKIVISSNSANGFRYRVVENTEETFDMFLESKTQRNLEETNYYEVIDNHITELNRQYKLSNKPFANTLSILLKESAINQEDISFLFKVPFNIDIATLLDKDGLLLSRYIQLMFALPGSDDLVNTSLFEELNKKIKTETDKTLTLQLQRIRNALIQIIIVLSNSTYIDKQENALLNEAIEKTDIINIKKGDKINIINTGDIVRSVGTGEFLEQPAQIQAEISSIWDFRNVDGNGLIFFNFNDKGYYINFPNFLTYAHKSDDTKIQINTNYNIQNIVSIENEIQARVLRAPGQESIILNNDTAQRAETIFARLSTYLDTNNLKGFIDEINNTIQRLKTSSNRDEQNLAEFYTKLKNYLFTKLGFVEV